MRHHGNLHDEEITGAAWEGGRGGLAGALKWGIGSALLGGVGYAISPIYRGLTFQFKVFLQMSGMIMGGSLEADHRIRDYEANMRFRKRLRLDKEAWERYEKEFEEQLARGHANK